MSEPFLGQVVIFGGNFAPRGWAFCDGQLLAIASNSALFSILGTIYGGDGRTTFALPDLRGRVPMGPRHGPGLSDYRLGQRGGVEDVILNITQIPGHTHPATATATSTATMMAESGAGSSPDPAGKILGSGTNIYLDNARANDVAMDPAAVSVNTDVSVTVGNAGNNLDHENRQPFLAINYIIALQGLFPSRS
ncbi:tail fiber protein [uncultured Tateyamaria sp.]|uniref:phage tail protein n=1 Tax=uncultured Tateyamaria sp. TaxID=455651 RepID=UPI0026329A35|nr:tail fiber protein [uncultured Tateyamaria sp.]